MTRSIIYILNFNFIFYYSQMISSNYRSNVTFSKGNSLEVILYYILAILC